MGSAEVVIGGGVHGVESVWRAMVNSMLASPPGNRTISDTKCESS